MTSQKVFIISGAQGGGKTTRLKDVLSLLQKKGRSFSGFVAEGSWENNKRIAFTLVNVKTNESVPLCGLSAKVNWQKNGRFYFNPEAIAIGEKWLGKSNTSPVDLIVIDEIGIFELDNKVWHPAFQLLLQQSNCRFIITVREGIVEQIIQKYKLDKVEVFSLKTTAEEIVERISE
jgi:nucleoside-triphosphatase THEP1